MKRTALLTIWVLFGTTCLFAQSMIPSVLPTVPSFGPTALFPAANSWIGLSQFPGNGPNQPFRWIFDSAPSVEILRTPRISVEAYSRLMFRFQPQGTNEWLFGAGDLITDLKLRTWAKLASVDVGFAYNHDCRHAVGEGTARLIIQDSLTLSATRAPIVIPWRLSGFDSSFWGIVDATLELPTIFQAGPLQPDQFELDGRIHANIVQEKAKGALFAEAGAAVTFRSTSTPVAAQPVSLDWHARIGIHSPSARHGTTLYLQLERLTDPWTTFTPQPVTLLSIGAVLASLGF